MMFTGTAGSRGIFSLRGDAPRFNSVFLFLHQKECDTEESHDRQASKMAKEGVV